MTREYLITAIVTAQPTASNCRFLTTEAHQSAIQGVPGNNIGDGAVNIQILVGEPAQFLLALHDVNDLPADKVTSGLMLREALSCLVSESLPHSAFAIGSARATCRRMPLLAAATVKAVMECTVQSD